jgi:hypothetical protein
MQALELMLTDIFIDGVNTPLTICVSFGFKDFTDITNLEQAIKSADEEMYRRKQENKQKRMHAQNASYRSNENTFVSLNR